MTPHPEPGAIRRTTQRIPTTDGLGLDVATYAPDQRPPGPAAAPVLAIPGLTRNNRDFDAIARTLAASGRTVHAVSLRGRGESDRDADHRNYHPLQYRDDVLEVLSALGCDEAVFLGTSLGGIVTMLTAEYAPQRVQAAIINDVGPRLAEEGLARIAAYVGDADASAAFADLDAATQAIRSRNEVAFPDRGQAFWQAFAMRTFRCENDGGWRLDYDPGIARALQEIGPAPDLWAAWRSLGAIPTLVIRGALSDLLTPAIIEEMRAARPGFAYAETPMVGHAPMLDEPESRQAILAFLDSL